MSILVDSPLVNWSAVRCWWLTAVLSRFVTTAQFGYFVLHRYHSESLAFVNFDQSESDHHPVRRPFVHPAHLADHSDFDSYPAGHQPDCSCRHFATL